MRLLRTTLATILTAVPRWALRQHQPVNWSEGRVLCSPALHHEAVDYPCADARALQEAVTRLWEKTAGTTVPDYLP